MVHEVTLRKQVLMTNGQALGTKEDILAFCKSKPDVFFILYINSDSFLVCSYCSTRNNLKAMAFNIKDYKDTMNILLNIPYSSKADINNVYKTLTDKGYPQYLDGWWNAVVKSKDIQWTQQCKELAEDTLKI